MVCFLMVVSLLRTGLFERETGFVTGPWLNSSLKHYIVFISLYVTEGGWMERKRKKINKKLDMSGQEIV